MAGIGGNDKPMTRAEIADAMAVNVRTVERWVRDGKLPAFRTPGGHLRVPREAVEAIVASANPEGEK